MLTNEVGTRSSASTNEQLRNDDYQDLQSQMGVLEQDTIRLGQDIEVAQRVRLLFLPLLQALTFQ